MKLTEKQIREGIRKILVKEFRGMAATTQGTLPARGLATQTTALATRSSGQLVPYTRPITTQVVSRALTPQVASQVFSHPVPQVARVVAVAGPQGGFVGPAQLVVAGGGSGGAGTTTALATTAGGGGSAAAAGVTLSAATILAVLAAGAAGWAVGAWIRESVKFSQEDCPSQIRYQAYQETGNIINFTQESNIYSDSDWNDYIRRNPGWQGIGPNQVSGGSGINCRKQLMLYFLAKETGNLSSIPAADQQAFEALFSNKYLDERLFKNAYDRAVARGQRELAEQARSAEQQRLRILRSTRAARPSAAPASGTTSSTPSAPTRGSSRSRGQMEL